MSNEYTGKDLVALWVYSGGTIEISTRQRNFASNPTVGLADATAGNDTDKRYIPRVKDATIDLSGLHQTAADGGSALVVALAEGTEGTLLVGREGSAAGKPKETYPAISMGAKLNIPYEQTAEFSVTFQKSGAKVTGAW